MVLTDFSPVILTFGVIGFLSGHVFLFLKDIIPATQGHDYVPTPRFLRQWFPDDRAVTATVAGRTLREPNQALKIKAFIGGAAAVFSALSRE
eukprot:CAMPEP_0176463528 /NCGR_PEP_ID=MMETSP0127-20121128/35941_1 /TAXON_ID=938130 /ORGANISM="Platyophrya macrostoma, Strain WH" /LENGTH=91 /DNA_ID=CAMNT_0017855703 /DNA_START=45 /DNA_END=318 /DNA_ORIENTATION=-